jgi:hypothetical protein
MRKVKAKSGSALTAEQIADHAIAQGLARAPEIAPTRQLAGENGEAPSLSEALAALHAQAAEARRTVNKRELTLFESQPEKIGQLVDRLIEGNYRDTAATLAGITSRSVRSWMKEAEAGDPRYETVAAVIRIAESLAEASAVQSVRAAGKLPQFWAARMTWLERKFPDRWGRRPDDTTVPRVIVQIGVKASDVQIGPIVPAALPPAPSTDR